MPEQPLTDVQEAELIQHVFYGRLDNLPNLASKIVRIFTSSTFTGKLISIFLEMFVTSMPFFLVFLLDQ